MLRVSFAAWVTGLSVSAAGAERVVFYRERGALPYDPFAYGVAVALVEIPYLLIQVRRRASDHLGEVHALLLLTFVVICRRAGHLPSIAVGRTMHCM